MPLFYFYILHCNDGTLYCGSTKNLESREAAHNLGKGSKYVSSHGGGTIIYSEQYPTWGEALSREAAVKKLSRKMKLELIQTADDASASDRLSGAGERGTLDS